MRQMGALDYVYTPISDEKRRRMQVAHRRRLGIPDDHCLIYGVHVPEQFEKPYRYWASWIAAKRGFEAATEFVKRAKASNFSGIAKPSPDRCGPADAVDYGLVRELLNEGASVDEVAEFLGRSANYMRSVLRGHRGAR